MSATDLERLLWQRIDGTLGAGELEQLENLLASEPEARRLETEIAQLASQLDDLEQLPAPLGLADDIRRAVRAAAGPAAAPAERAPAPWLAGLRRLLQPQPVRRLAWVAAGLVVAVVGYQLVTGTVSREDGTFTGTAGLTEPGSGAPAVRIDLPGERGALSVSRRGATLLVELEVTPELGAATLAVRGAGLWIESTGQRGDATLALRGAGDGVELGVAGSGAVTLAVGGAGLTEPVRVEVGAGTETLLSRELVLENLPEQRSATNF